MEIQKLNELLDNESKDTYSIKEMVGIILRGAYSGKIDYETAKRMLVEYCGCSIKDAKDTIIQLDIDKKAEYNNWMAKCCGEPQNFLAFVLPQKEFTGD